jgi:ribonucleoside-diphosphate reductase alpha chain
MGFTKNPDIKIAKSLVDYIFRWLGITFLPGFREANKMLPPATADGTTPDSGDPEGERKPAATKAGGPNGAQGSVKPTAASIGSSNGSPNGTGAKVAAKRTNGSTTGVAVLDRMAATVMESPSSQLSRSEQFASFQADAPTCDNCGAITVRNGNCYLCHNCGSSMGCS